MTLFLQGQRFWFGWMILLQPDSGHGTGIEQVGIFIIGFCSMLIKKALPIFRRKG